MEFLANVGVEHRDDVASRLRAVAELSDDAGLASDAMAEQRLNEFVVVLNRCAMRGVQPLVVGSV